MRGRITSLLSVLAVAAAPLAAGVVYEIETTDHEASPPRVESTEVAAGGKNLKMEIAPDEQGRGRGDAIFRGDRREMIVVDHDEKSYVVIDEATMKELAAKLGGINDQIAEALKNVPEEQRAMVEKMMKERMPAPPPPRQRAEVRRTGERATHSGYPCVKYEVVRGGTKIRELWVTDWGNVEGGGDVTGAFQAMAEFMQEMLDALPAGGAPGGMGDSVIAQMNEIDGFPVVTREFGDDGSLEDESTLRSAQRRTLDPAEFEPPAGYKRRSMMGSP